MRRPRIVCENASSEVTHWAMRSAVPLDDTTGRDRSITHIPRHRSDQNSRTISDPAELPRPDAPCPSRCYDQIGMISPPRRPTRHQNPAATTQPELPAWHLGLGATCVQRCQDPVARQGTHLRRTVNVGVTGLVIAQRL